MYFLKSFYFWVH